jgi:hypothetical protein
MGEGLPATRPRQPPVTVPAVRVVRTPTEVLPVSAVTPEQARDFYRAAATFYRQGPWRSAGGDEPIGVGCEQLEGGPRLAVVLGKAGGTRGLWACDDWTTCFLLQNGDYKIVEVHLQYTALHFGDRPRISPNDLEKVKRPGFEVAGTDAYPAVLRRERGRDFGSPDAGELELLEACLWVIPDFLKRAGDRGPGVYEYAFKGMTAKLTLDPSWVPKERLRVDHPGVPI